MNAMRGGLRNLDNMNTKAMVSLSFDDGWKNQLTRGVPILDTYGFKGTFYVITRMPEYMLHEGEGRMTLDEWKHLAVAGHEIGGHSQTHPNLARLLPWRAKKEIVGSYDDLVALGITPSTFAYPYGIRNFLVRGMASGSPYVAARLAQGNAIDMARLPNRYAIPAYCVMAADSFETIQTMIDNAVANKHWLILAFHQIENNPPPWGSEPEMLDRICAYLKEKNIRVVTIADGIKEVYG